MNNVAAGAWLSSVRPFRKGELVEINKFEGRIESVSLTSTEMLTPDNTYITIPNSVVWGSPILNYSRIPHRRVSIEVRVGYQKNLHEVIRSAMKLMCTHKLSLDSPKPTVVIKGRTGDSITLELRAWTHNEYYFKFKSNLTFIVLDKFKKRDF